MKGRDELIGILENASCGDPFECPFDMYGRNKEGKYGCFARFPGGTPDEEDQGCIAHQAARLLKQETVHPEYEGDARSSWWYVCEECHTRIEITDHFCRTCGGRIIW